MNLHDSGYDSCRSSISKSTLANLRDQVFAYGEAGTRCLLDVPLVQRTAVEIRESLVAAAHLPTSAIAIQAIAFDKTPDANWKVTWHQDLMFPFARPATQIGFDLRCMKAGVDYARPPRDVLEELLAVRLHVDDCNESNGPLRVSPGSHRDGILKSTEIQEHVARHGEAICTAKAGEVFLMRPLLLHASSPSTKPRHRRVLHLVFHTGRPISERWHRAV